ncbi:MAG: hypothetical protein ACJ0QQ_06140 [Parvicellaceae bacterium]
MKKLIVFMLIIPIYSFSQKKKTAFITYFVPISKDVKKNYSYTSNRGTGYEKYCSSLLLPSVVENNSSDSINSSFLTIESKQILFKNIFNKAKNGELVVYQHNDGKDFYGPAPDDTWLGKKQILKKQEVQRNISYLLELYARDKDGNLIFDDNGEHIYESYLLECNIDDFIGIKFYEEWTFNYKSLTVDKKILYYAPGIKLTNPITGLLDGIRFPFIVENKNLKTNQIIATDFYTNTDVFCNNETSNLWFSNNLEPSVKFPFIKEAMTNENNSFYECAPPYNKKISNIEALSYEASRDSIADSTEPAVDENANTIIIKYLEYYVQDEINSFGFLENWFFDDRASSFSKEVSGISLEVFNYSENLTEPIFLIKD